MCGIFGWAPDPAGSYEDPAAVAARQFAALAHRGPDDRGFTVFNAEGRLMATEKGRLAGVGGRTALLLGQTRLSIIDLSAAGHQPMFSPDGRFTLAYNGEVYNYLEIRRELAEQGVFFRTGSDTEVVLAALSRWGRTALDRFEGMFALALFDAHDKTIFCARDIFGIKPLYWFRPGPRSFAFSSELPALLRLPGQARRLEARRAYNYLSAGRVDEGDGCLLEGVSQLAPGHSLTVNLAEGGRLYGPEPYFRFRLKEPLTISFEEAAEETRRLFLKSVALHLRSDVPLGVALSGGIDSTAVACAVRRLAPAASLTTFSFVAPGHAVSEEEWIDLAAVSLGARSHKISAAPNDLFNDMDDLILRQGEPFGSTSIYAQYRVFQLARAAGVVVTLEGQGADELLAGYNGFTHLRLQSLLRRGELRRALAILQGIGHWPGRGAGAALKSLLGPLLPPALKPMFRAASWPRLRPPWFKANAWHGGAESDFPPPFLPPSPDKLRRGLARQLTWAGLPSLLRHSDRNAMTFSLESRVPFCSREMAEFLLSLPEEYLVTDAGLTKAVFRRAMRGLVPDEILDRRDKIGFATPERDWLLGRASWVEENLLSGSSELLDGPAMVKHWRLVRRGRRPFDWRIWRWINYLRWKDLLGISE
jgi:asparagine synthase (glutamine-hydrolysing)